MDSEPLVAGERRIERLAAIEARFSDFMDIFRVHSEREEKNQEACTAAQKEIFSELQDIKQFLHTAKTMGWWTVWLGGAAFAILAALPAIATWVQTHVH